MSDELDIIDSFSNVTKWEQSTEDFNINYRAGERQNFLLSPYHLEFKSIFQITGIYFITTQETDFILDAEITTIVKIETKGITPKAEQLYNVY